METRLLYDRKEAAHFVKDSTCHKFLSAADASVFLGGINHRTVTRWAREGYLPAYPIGEGKRRLWRFLEADLEAWMLSRRTGAISDLHSGSAIGAFGGI